MEKIRLEISSIELTSLDREDWKYCVLGDFYLTRTIKFANELGLRGKKIKEIIGMQENFATEQRYIDFVCEKGE